MRPTIAGLMAGTVSLVCGVVCADPLPALTGVKTLAFTQKQGGPSIMRCNGVVYAITVDVASNAWTLGQCTFSGADKMVISKGRLTVEERKDLEAGYAALDADPKANSCGHDGGTLSLEVTTKAGAKTGYVDMNWGCVKPPPVQIAKLPDVSRTLYQRLLEKSPPMPLPEKP